MMNRYKSVKYSAKAVQKDVILNLFQNLQSLFKLGDAGSGSVMTKLSLLVYLILFVPPAVAQEKLLEWHSFEEAVQLAEETQKPILVDVWAPWCGWCKKMQKEVFPELFGEFSDRFVWTRLNRDDNETSLKYKNQNFTPLRLAQTLNTQDVPALIFLSPQGDYLFHTSGFMEAENLEPFLEYVASGSHTEMSFESFHTNNY